MADPRSGSAVVPLTGTNFATWKIQCRMLLMKMGVWRIVDGTEDAPDEYDVVAYRKYVERRDKALASIVLAVHPSLLYLLGDPQDPEEVWEKLCNQFQKKTWANKLVLKKKLWGLKLKDKEPVQDHIKAMTEIFEELAIIGYPVEEEDRVVQLLASLPESFSMIVTALEACAEVPKLEVVTERLFHEERKLQEKSALESQNNVVSNPHDALFVGSGRGKAGPVCFFCGKHGHVKKFCDEWKEWQKKKEDSESKKEAVQVANFSHVRNRSRSDSEDSDVECIALVSEVVPEKKKEWIVDSAATGHMCNNVKLMTNVRKLKQSENIKVGNGDVVEAQAKGTVKLDIHDGNKARKFKLDNVLLAPGLKYNLLSVSRAAEAGKKVEFGRQGCKIIDSKTNETVGTGIKVGNLYKVNCQNAKLKRTRKNRRNVNSKQMERALNIVAENNFRSEIMKRLERIEKKDSHTIISKEEKNQSQEDIRSRTEGRNDVEVEIKEEILQKEYAGESADDDKQDQMNVEENRSVQKVVDMNKNKKEDVVVESEAKVQQ